MKTMIKSTLALILTLGLGFAAQAQKFTSAPASATVLADLTIDLDGTQNEIAFGNLSANTPGSIVLDANGTDNANTGTITNVARFNLTGADTEVTVSYDATVTLSNTDPTPATMVMTPEVVGNALNTGQTSAAAIASGNTIEIENGVFFIWVGGTIPALVNQATGTYTGTFNINVEYN
ncbi:DUF4402 domain-containing protein [Algoriphagus mannitolivorans]|uniref:DUF4402 domain-containing protein n=1 Tax=Algoriphagus mannitolivorans TaxID=226504 RepID=UPI00041C6428|nr:DUF4402 domain-containing protein [Algoriphagus mannitolivorans]